MRTEVERRPAVIACLALVVGMSAGLSLVNALLIIPFFWLRAIGPRAIAAIGFSLGVILAPREPPPTPLNQVFVDGLGTVVSVPEVSAGGRRSVIRLASGDYFLYHNAALMLSLGDQIRVKGVVKPLSETGDWARRKGISGRVVPAELRVVRPGTDFARLGLAWREGFLGFCRTTLDAPAAQAVGALCFNAGGQLDKETKQNLQRSGTTHIISVSGLHVMIFALGLSGLLSLFPVPRIVQLALLILLLAIYATATGLQPPVVRSAVMAAIVFCAYVVRREPDLLSALAIAALAFLLWNPTSILDIGFQLSFVTVGMLALYLKPADAPEAGLAARQWFQIKILAMASLVASAGSAPIVAYHFGIVSIISVLANLLIVAALAPVTLLALASFGISFISLALSVGVMKLVVEPLTGWILLVVNVLGSLPFAAVEVPPFNGYWLVPIYGAMLLTWRKHVRQP